MIKKIYRHHLFETNSSSSHSLVIERINFHELNFETYVKGVLDLNGGSFEWGYDLYDDPETKANYIAISLWLNYDLEVKLGSYEKAYKIEQWIKLFERTIKEHSDIKIINYNFKEDEDYRFMIDHQSDDLIIIELEDYKTEQEIMDYFYYSIFNFNSKLIIDNDNG